MNVAVYVVSPFVSQVAAFVTADVVFTVSVSLWEESRVHVLVAVTLLLSVAQVYVGVPQLCPSAAMLSTVFVCFANALFVNVAVYVVSPFVSQVAAFVTADVVFTVSVSLWEESRVHVLVAVTLLLSLDQVYVGVPQLWPRAATVSVVLLSSLPQTVQYTASS